MRKLDPLERTIHQIIIKSRDPLETIEVIAKLNEEIGETSRSKVMYRLNNLRAIGSIGGKAVGSGKGTWVWYQTIDSETEEK